MTARLLRLVQLCQWSLAALLCAALAAYWNWSLAAALCLAAVLPLALHASIIAADFALAHWAGSPTPVPLRPGIGGLLRIYLTELRDSIWMFQFVQPWLAGRQLPGQPPHNAVAGEAIPVVLIHGYLCNRQLWHPMAGWLADRGHCIEAVDLEPVFGSIDDYAPLIDQAVRSLRERTGSKQVALVCHSMGGLAARAYLRAFPDAPVQRVVTLGTPHRGTFHARFGNGINAKQMRIDSPWLQALAQSEDSLLRQRFSIVLSHHDNIVAPQAVQTLADATVIELGGLGHVSLALDESVWGIVAQELRR